MKKIVSNLNTSPNFDKNALEYYNGLKHPDQMNEEEKNMISEEEKDRIEFFQGKSYILKETLRVVPQPNYKNYRNENVEDDNHMLFKEIEGADLVSNVGRYRFLGSEQLRNEKVAFIIHCDCFDCFYIDSSQQLQKISIPMSQFNELNNLEQIMQDL